MVVSSSAEESRSLIAISVGGNEVLRRRRGLVLTLEDVIEEVIIGEGVEAIRADDEGMGEEGGE